MVSASARKTSCTVIMRVNLSLIATKANSADFVSLLCPHWQKKVLTWGSSVKIAKTINPIFALTLYGFIIFVVVSQQGCYLF